LVEQLALDLPETEVESVNTLVGDSATDISNYEMAQNLAQVWIELREGEARELPSNEVMDLLRQGLASLPPSVESFEIDQPQSGPSGRAIEISVRGPDLDVLGEISAGLQEDLRGYAGTRDVHDNLDEGKREVRITLTDRARTLGFTEDGIAAELRSALEGTTWAHLRRGTDDVELVVKLPETVREKRGALERLRITSPTGARLPLASLVELHDGVGPAVITHDGRQRSATVLADVDKREGNASDIVTAIATDWADLPDRWPGYELSLRGDYEDTAQAMDGLASAALISMITIYLILGTLFHSFSQPLVIMFIIPFAGMGMILGHWVMSREITLLSLIGTLALMGVVVNDSLILVDFINQKRAQGDALMRALVEAGRLRFRPIVLTSITTMLGLTPLTFFATGQARFLQPMAISLFFGLAFSTILILILVPCAYAVLQDILAWVGRPRETLRLMRRRQPVHN
jgi:multidrug efflux pump subunit AcrB